MNLAHATTNTTHSIVIAASCASGGRAVSVGARIVSELRAAKVVSPDSRENDTPRGRRVALAKCLHRKSAQSADNNARFFIRRFRPDRIGTDFRTGVFDGYFGEPETSLEVFDASGWEPKIPVESFDRGAGEPANGVEDFDTLPREPRGGVEAFDGFAGVLAAGVEAFDGVTREPGPIVEHFDGILGKPEHGIFHV